MGKDVGQLMRLDSSRSVCLLMACCVLAACTQDPDLKATASGELIRIAATAKKGEPPDSLASRAAQELFRRPGATVVESLRTALKNESAGIRSWSAQALGECLADAIKPRLEAGTRDDLEAALFELLGDEDEGVRASALYSLGHGCVVRRPDSVRDEIVGAIRSLVISANSSSRFLAANAAMWFGPAVRSVAPLLVAQAKVEADGGVRFMLATALSRVGPQDPAVVSCLRIMLDDTDEKVRYSAATGLGEIVAPPTSVVERLRRSVTHASEAADVRKSAATSLAKLTTSSEDAGPTLSALLDVKELFADYELSSWLDAVGKVAALLPTGESAAGARNLLESAAHSEDQHAAVTAMSGLARIAFATRDAGLGRQAAAELRKVVPSILSAAEEELPWSAEAEWAVPVMEALVILAGWPEMKISADQLRPVFAALKRHRFCWTRAWADGQLGRMP